MDFSFDNYLQKVISTTTHKYNIDEFYGKSAKDISSLQQNIQTDFSDILGLDRIPFKTVSLSPIIIESAVDMGDYTREKISLTICEDLTFPMYLLRPKSTTDKTNVALFCHGHGIGYKSTVGLDENGNPTTKEDYHHNFPIELCKLGYTVAVPEIIAFGETKLTYDSNRTPLGHASCHMIATNLLMKGTTLGGLRVYQAMRVIDYLLSLPNVNTDNVVCMGISGGGMLTAFVSALDTRIKTAVISGYLSSFKDSILGLEHCICNFVPNMFNLFEMDCLAATIFPRNIIVEAGTLDDIFPIAAVRQTCDKLRKLYDEHGLSNLFELETFEAGHQISGKLAYQKLKLY